MANALKAWELENAVKLVDPNRDALYDYDDAAHQAVLKASPWKSDPHYFKHVRISAVALLKMVMHAREGGSIEVMGLMTGTVQGDTFVITDAFRLPVEGTETRVNAQDEANEYMIEFTTKAREAGLLENPVGWYHSHPGYGCWLSGIDVGTQKTQQLFQDPFLAVVIDPDRTISAGKVEIGAFRTFPEGYKPDIAASEDGFQAIPMAKIEDFGAHASSYYSLDVSHFKSTLDASLLEALWNKYWVGTLASSPLLLNRDYGTRQIQELALKIRQADKKANARGTIRTKMPRSDDMLEKVVRAGCKIAAEERAGLLASEVKSKLFGGLENNSAAQPTDVDEMKS